MKRPKSSRWLRLARWAPLLVGGTALQLNLGSCDSNVRDTVLSGIQDAMTTLITSVIDAFFLSLQDIGGSTSQPIVKAIIEDLPRWLA